MMWTLVTLGRIALTGDDGSDLEELLRQPKRFALLVYLCSPRPGTWHRRDELVARFWPEFDTHRARTALRNAIYVLRKALGDEVVRGRGDEEISIDPGRLRYDAAEFEAAAAEGRHALALEQYHGDLLPGLFVGDAAGFEEWLAGERDRLRATALQSAIRHSAELESSHDIASAIAAARLALTLDGHNEQSIQRLVTLLDKSGDRAGALAAFERFRERLHTELEVEPSPETLKLVSRIRQRVGDPIATAPLGPRDDLPVIASEAKQSGRSAAKRSNRTARLAVAAAGVLAIGALGLAALPGPVDDDTPVVLLLPVEHPAVDSLEALAGGIAADLNDRLLRVPGIRVRSVANGKPLRGAEAMRAAKAGGAGHLLQTTLVGQGDSIALKVVLKSAPDDQTEWTATFVSHLRDLELSASRITGALAGRLLGTPLPPLDPQRPVDPESYRLTLQGLQNLIGGGGETGADQEAYGLFKRASEIDPTNARAWTGLSSAWTSRGVRGRYPEEEAFARGEDAGKKALALDSAQGMAWGNLGIIKLVRDGDLAGGEALFRRGMMVEPGNTELYLIFSVLLRFAGQYDRALDQLRIAERLDPFSLMALERQAFVELCAGRPDRALAGYRRLLQAAPGNPPGHRGLVRTLARMDRFDEAIAAWRADPRLQKDSALAAVLAGARGREGYWNAIHFAGRRELPRILRDAGDHYVAPIHIGRALIRAGELDSGIAVFEREAALGARPLFRLHCFDDTDEALNHPRYQALLRRIPHAGSTIRR